MRMHPGRAAEKCWVFQHTPEVWVYILLEHQSDPDPWMPFRLLTYMMALWESERRDQEERKVPLGERRLSPILPIVLYTGQRAWGHSGTS